MDYSDYLKSPRWAWIREKVLKRDHYRCRSCGRKAWQVHHGSYSRATMEGRDLSQLFAVCGQCHLAATFTVTGAKRPPAERLEMAAALNRPEPKPKRMKKPKPPKKKRPRLDIAGIRALSLRYAEGRMP